MNLDKLTKQLFPTGRAFKFPNGKNGALVMEAINENVNTAIVETKGILNTILPDNDQFTEADATVWEKRLALQTSEDLEIRKANISRKLNQPGACKGRMSLLYFQNQLQKAGFNVYVHPNKFSDGMGGYTVINPGDGSGEFTQHGLAIHGISTHGSTGFKYDSQITNHDNKAYEVPPVYTNEQLRATFFIGGSSFPNVAYIPAEREKEFRKLILTLKGQHLVGFLITQYI